MVLVDDLQNQILAAIEMRVSVFRIFDVAVRPRYAKPAPQNTRTRRGLEVAVPSHRRPPRLCPVFAWRKPLRFEVLPPRDHPCMCYDIHETSIGLPEVATQNEFIEHVPLPWRGPGLGERCAVAFGPLLLRGPFSDPVDRLVNSKRLPRTTHLEKNSETILPVHNRPFLTYLWPTHRDGTTSFIGCHVQAGHPLCS